MSCPAIICRGLWLIIDMLMIRLELKLCSYILDTSNLDIGRLLVKPPFLIDEWPTILE